MHLTAILREYFAIRSRRTVASPRDCWAIATFRVTGEWPEVTA